MPDGYRVIAWADAGQEPFVREAASHESFDFVAVGSASSAAAADLSRDLQAERFDDLRQLIARGEGDIVWLLGAEQVDRDALRLLAERGAPAFTSHPQPAALGEFLSSGSGALPTPFVPLMRRAHGFSTAAQVRADFGEVGTVNVAFRSGRMHGGGLFGRLYDAMDVIEHLCGEALVIDAALSGAAESPETLSALHGHMTINMRFADGRCACAALSDGAGAWFRGVTVLGEAGCLRISDDGFEWLDPAGRLVDSHEADRSLSPGAIAAEHIACLMDSREPAEAPQTQEDHARLLALCEAARLSCRTGQGEAPRKVLEMLSRP